MSRQGTSFVDADTSYDVRSWLKPKLDDMGRVGSEEELCADWFPAASDMPESTLSRNVQFARQLNNELLANSTDWLGQQDRLVQATLARLRLYLGSDRYDTQEGDSSTNLCAVGRVALSERSAETAIPVTRFSTEVEFRKCVSRWKHDTLHFSMIRDRAMHPAYQRIIGMGDKALPLIMRELVRELDDWFWALEAITGCDPVPATDRGDMIAMRSAWLEYGRKHDYL
jgi:hypothetical protein